MAASSSTRKTTIVFAGVVGGTQEIEAAENETSPACVTLHTLTEDPIEIEIPEGATCATIVKPSDNTYSIFIAGLEDDSGLELHPTDPDSISIGDGEMWMYIDDNDPESSLEMVVRIFWS